MMGLFDELLAFVNQELDDATELTIDIQQDLRRHLDGLIRANVLQTFAPD